ncbi:hypothetical protein JOY44_29560 (plasmid) [Phormidium sp. CLA17]|uniref:hypothetical protein n=1 Tax=Leptolyngbya sp. Cla-17 TaxID=2803751 RepID=UPI0019321876|nr:hypothetical protein [Leptolyngbya sp. Cla-17]MBM0745570.1 hypothetical protein [Leptolyngbya sp. Cla-17]
MPQLKPLTHDSDLVWFIGVPKCQEFTQPQFYFGERVKWPYKEDGHRIYRTGRIFGMTFTSAQQWQYEIHLDLESSLPVQEDGDVTIPETALKLVPDSQSIRPQLRPEPDWRLTQVAAQTLGVSAEQLRKLRRRGLFKSGYHYRDISVPGSGKSRWQWHAIRCGKALEVPSEKRPVPKQRRSSAQIAPLLSKEVMSAEGMSECSSLGTPTLIPQV